MAKNDQPVKTTRTITEGTIIKGGVNPKPSTPKPNVQPVGHKPSSEQDKKQ